MMQNHEIVSKVDLIMFRDALSFYDSASTLKSNPSDMSNRPYYVLLAFSVELFIKSINVKHQVQVNEKKQFRVNSHKVKLIQQGHQPDEIFRKLIESKNEMADYLSQKYEEIHGRSLIDDLEINNHIFVDMRYTYPKNEQIVNNGRSTKENNRYYMPEILEQVSRLIYQELSLLVKGERYM